MSSSVSILFKKPVFQTKIQSRLPRLFQIAETDSSRAGKIGMEVGNLRERILVSIFLIEFNKNEVVTEIPTTEQEVDVIVKGESISIKIITGKRLSGVKLIWTVESIKANEFRKNYEPVCNILLVQINWLNVDGGLYYIPKTVQQVIFSDIGRNEYIKLPKPGTNPRGVEISRSALEKLTEHENTIRIPIFWKKQNILYDPYTRWISL